KKMSQILEFLKSKEINDEEMKEKAYEELLEWARDDLEKENPEEWIEEKFDLDELPRMKVKGAKLDLTGTAVSYLPENLEIESLIIRGTKNLKALPVGIRLKKLDAAESGLLTLEGVEVTMELDINGNKKIISLPRGTKLQTLYAAESALSNLDEVEVTKVLGINNNKKIKSLARGTKLENLYASYDSLATLAGVEVTGYLSIRHNKQIKSLPEGMKVEVFEAEECGLEDLPDDLIVSGVLTVKGCSDRVKRKARELKERGQIQGLVL
ncbi:DUF2262 domain-containing protein, partial [Patescibacteria group bacterium]|nr:DUF2262 domain-containing protein [Patescibacteria group bacterium]